MTVGQDAAEPRTRTADVERKVEIVRVLVEVGSAADAAMAQVLTEAGVPTSVASTLWALAPGTEPPTMRDLAARLRCDPSTVSLVADKLQSMGLVTRQPHPADGRKRTLALTEQGHALWEALRTRLHASGMFAILAVQEQDTLLALLRKMRSPQHAQHPQLLPPRAATEATEDSDGVGDPTPQPAI